MQSKDLVKEIDFKLIDEQKYLDSLFPFKKQFLS